MARYVAGVALSIGLSFAMAGPLAAQSIIQAITSVFTGGGEDNGARLKATIWVDPDGCEHWVMDDGLEGFMSSHLDRNGKPVCRGAATTNSVCKTLDSAATFAIGSAKLKPEARSELETYFASLGGKTIVVNGHTDNTGGAQANLELSLRRAIAVSDVAQEFGVTAVPRGYGEQLPLVPNTSAEGRAQNRRVELTCS